ncbi:MAG: hypothetical protein HFJ28_03910 [Clostridia bacterium]|nr:hypothetical protein [Clostridia bacterium]
MATIKDLEKVGFEVKESEDICKITVVREYRVDFKGKDGVITIFANYFLDKMKWVKLNLSSAKGKEGKITLSGDTIIVEDSQIGVEFLSEEPEFAN